MECVLCKSSKKDNIQYGDFLVDKQGRMGVHTFCLYLSSNLAQRGKDNDGFIGFLKSDIRREVKRISRLACCYCNKFYANIGCCKKKCPRSFHLICGLENGVENQFCHSYASYCHVHTSQKNLRHMPNINNELCCICYDKLCIGGKSFNPLQVITAPCCHNGWFHRYCLLKLAKTSGYFFKCPLCNDSQKFREQMKFKGIYIPNQDAAWELEPNAYVELLYRPDECTADVCRNNKGRKAINFRNPLILCQSCGSTARHKFCLLNKEKTFICNDCILPSVKSSNTFTTHSRGTYAATTCDNTSANINFMITKEEKIHKIDVYCMNEKNEVVSSCADKVIPSDDEENPSSSQLIYNKELFISRSTTEMDLIKGDWHLKPSKNKRRRQSNPRKTKSIIISKRLKYDEKKDDISSCSKYITKLRGDTNNECIKDNSTTSMNILVDKKYIKRIEVNEKKRNLLPIKNYKGDGNLEIESEDMNFHVTAVNCPFSSSSSLSSITSFSSSERFIPYSFNKINSRSQRIISTSSEDTAII